MCVPQVHKAPMPHVAVSIWRWVFRRKEVPQGGADPCPPRPPLETLVPRRACAERAPPLSQVPLSPYRGGSLLVSEPDGTARPAGSPPPPPGCPMTSQQSVWKDVSPRGAPHLREQGPPYAEPLASSWGGVWGRPCPGVVACGPCCWTLSGPQVMSSFSTVCHRSQFRAALR